ncbi:MAG: type II toxin-antitoxin system HicB family antitoxin [Methylococcaceae bacterium]|nr:type II toxin-antitoxin system HicB family antitoxin [Methylococcaceae bacterium]
MGRSPRCATQGETIEELLTNLYEAVEACLSVDLEDIELATNDSHHVVCSLETLPAFRYLSIKMKI